MNTLPGQAMTHDLGVPSDRPASYDLFSVLPSAPFALLPAYSRWSEAPQRELLTESVVQVHTPFPSLSGPLIHACLATRDDTLAADKLECPETAGLD